MSNQFSLSVLEEPVQIIAKIADLSGQVTDWWVGLEASLRCVCFGLLHTRPSSAFLKLSFSPTFPG